MLRYFSYNNNSFLYAFRILLGSSIVWWTLNMLHDDRKIWALISIIIVSDPDFDILRKATVSRVVNTLTGCVLGLLFIYFAGINFWSLMAAITVSVIISTSFKKYPTTWKLAPVTVAILMAPSMGIHESWKDASKIALTRTAEVLYGSLVAFLLGMLFSVLVPKWNKWKQFSDIKKNPPQNL